jgi:alanine racemase
VAFFCVAKLLLIPLFGMETLFDRLLTYAEIDLDAVAHNIRTIMAYTGPAVEFMAVLKANAYGHGAVQIARAALAHGATRLAVARVDEGIQLRRAGITAPVLVLGYSLPAESDQIVSHDLTATVNTIEVAQALSSRAAALGKTVTIHVKVDSGMGRYGLLPDEVLPFLAQVTALPGLDLEGMFTHFAAADELDKSFTRQQLAVFLDTLQVVREAGYTIRLRHAANSAATLDLPETHLDAVRVGIALYGLPPSDGMTITLPLKPVLSFKSHVARIRLLPPGYSIGYGRTYITSRPTRVALVPAGYADGYHRSLSNRSHVLIRGQRAPVIGRVSMDQITVDVSAIEDVSQNDEVVLIGSQGKVSVTATELGSLAGTINYEILTSMSPRVPRVYRRGGEVVEATGLNHNNCNPY